MPAVRTVLAPGLIALALVGTLSACGSTDQADPATVPLSASPTMSTPSATPLAVPSGVPTELPSAPASQEKSQKSANAFATYVALLDYRVVYTRDVAPLLALVAPGQRCPGCEKAAQEVKHSKQQVFAVPSHPPTVLGAVPTSSNGDEYVVGVAFKAAPAKVMDASGKVLGTMKGYPNNYVEVHMKWDDAAATWRLEDFNAQIGESQ